MCNPITRTSFVPWDHSLPFAHVHLSQVCVFFSPPPWCNIIFQWPFWRVSVRPWEACLVFDNISFINLGRPKLSQKLRIKTTTYICYERERSRINRLERQVRREFMSNMQDYSNLWTWFSSFSSRSLFKNVWDLFKLWSMLILVG
jgi:hypothetical protein